MPAISLITTVPQFITPAEHAALVGDRTPESFAAIPPVCRHQEAGVRVVIDPPLPENEWATEDATAGTLYVLESALIFASTTGKVFSVPYPAITLHAVSRSSDGPSVYCQLDDSDPEAPEPENDDEPSPLRELSLIPPNPDSLEPIFEAFSLCASLHPDPNMEDEDMLDSDAFIDADVDSFEVFIGEGDEELSAVGRVRNDFQTPDARYAPY